MAFSAKDILSQINSAKIEVVGVHDLMPYARNARIHEEWQVAKIASSIKEFGFVNPVIIDPDGGIIAGHGRVLAALKLGLEIVPCRRVGHLTEPQKRAYILVDNRLAEEASWDVELAKLELAELALEDIDLKGAGLEDWSIGLGLGASGTEGNEEGKPAGNLADRFIVPPFSVLDARQGYWQERKRGWLALGIESEVGRGGNLLKFSDGINARQAGEGKNYDEAKKTAKAFSTQGPLSRGDRPETETGTSIFDPVLCELAYRWFCPKGGSVLDPFAGGSVRGVVASQLGLVYTGHELRGEQCAANASQAEKICQGKLPVWIEGDSAATLKHHEADTFDFVMSCPPYADLEVYSDDPADLSNMPYGKFIDSYRDIIAKAVRLMKPNRFAFWVIGEVREKNPAGYYRGFVPDTIKAFEDAGARLYNEIILVTAVGTLPLRAGRTFSASRKIGKTHQNVLVFCRGDPRKACETLGEIETADLEAMAAAASDGEVVE